MCVERAAAVPAEDSERSVRRIDGVVGAGTEPLFVCRARGACGARAAGDVELADAGVVELGRIPVFAGEQVLHACDRCAVVVILVDLERAVVERGDLERCALVENRARARDGAQRCVTTDGADVEEDGLNEQQCALR